MCDSTDVSNVDFNVNIAGLHNMCEINVNNINTVDTANVKMYAIDDVYNVNTSTTTSHLINPHTDKRPLVLYSDTDSDEINDSPSSHKCQRLDTLPPTTPSHTTFSTCANTLANQYQQLPWYHTPQ